MAYQKYTIGDVDEILQGLSGDKLIFTRHSFKRADSREIDEDYVRNMIFNEDPLDIDSDKKANEFRLFYPSQLHNNKELVVVIAIDEGYVIVQSLWEAKRIFKR